MSCPNNLTCVESKPGMPAAEHFKFQNIHTHIYIYVYIYTRIFKKYGFIYLYVYIDNNKRVYGCECIYTLYIHTYYIWYIYRTI